MSGPAAPTPMSAAPMPAAPTSAPRRAPRWGVQTGFIQLRVPAFWLYVGVAVISILYFVVVQVVELLVSPAGWLLSWFLMVLYIVPVVLVLRWVDLYEHEPRSMLIAAFLWGGLVATFFAGFGNDLWGVVIARLGGAEFAGEWSAALTAPVIEETYKYLGLVVLYLIARLEFDDLVDGFVYGALIGLGFAVVEDIFYFMFAFGGDIGSVINGFYVRVLASGLYGHVTFTGISGIGFAYFVTRRADATLLKRTLVAAGLLLLAMAAHFVWNSPLLYDLDPILYGLFKGLPFLIGLVILVYLARRRENQDLREVLAPEIGKAGILPQEMEALRDRQARRAATKRVAQAAGPAAEKVFKRLQREQIRLALTTSAVDSPDDARLLTQRLVCLSLRTQLWQYPGAAAALGISPEDVMAAPQPPGPFAPTKVVGVAGGWAWLTPDQYSQQRIGMPPAVPLQILEDRGGWLLVRNNSNWLGWTGAPYLADMTAAG